MRKWFLLFIGLFFYSASFSQLTDNPCDNFIGYKEMIGNKDKLNKKTPSENMYESVTGYGNSELDALYDLKIKLLHYLTYKTEKLENPLLDTILGQFAGEIIQIPQNAYRIAKSKKKDRIKGKYTAFLMREEAFYYYPEALDFVKKYVNEFLNYTVVFIVNPSIKDQTTKQVYDEALNQLHTCMLKSDYKFNNVLERRLIKLANLQKAPSDYNPCKDGFHIYKTGQKYLDFIEALRHNENFTYDLDLLISIDTIIVDDISLSDKNIVTFRFIGYNVNSAVELFKYEIIDTVSKASPLRSVQMALSDRVICSKLNDLMYDIIKRYALYVKEGTKFSIKICQNFLQDNRKRLMFKRKLLSCKVFTGMRESTWTMKGTKIGYIYTGFSREMNRMEISLIIEELLMDMGIENYEIHIYGNEFFVCNQTQN